MGSDMYPCDPAFPHSNIHDGFYINPSDCVELDCRIRLIRLEQFDQTPEAFIKVGRFIDILL